jgi:hypothetical protein
MDHLPDAIIEWINAMNDRLTSIREVRIFITSRSLSYAAGRGPRQRPGDGCIRILQLSWSAGHPASISSQGCADKYGTGTHGVRSLAGSLTIHRELEETIAAFKGAETAVTFSSGYATNLSVISSLVGRNDFVISDKLNHASIVDGCVMSGAKFLRPHNDMGPEQRLIQASGAKLAA